MNHHLFNRRQFIAGAGATGLGLLVSSSVSGGRPALPVRAASSVDIAMAGIDPANTSFVPGVLPDGMPNVGDAVQGDAAFSLALIESAGLLLLENVLYAVGRHPDNTRALFALDAETGAEIWRVEEVDALLAVTPTAVIVERLGDDNADDVVIAIDQAGSHGELWRIAARPQGRTVVVGDRLIVSTSAGLVMVNIDTGEISWERDVDITATLLDVAVSGNVIVGTQPTESSRVDAWHVETGEPLWSVTLDRPVQTAPLVDGESVLVCDPQEIIDLDLRSGAERRRLSHGWTMTYRGTMALAGGIVVVRDIAGCRAIDRDSGEIAWRYTPFFGMASGMLCAGDMLFLLANEGADFESAQVLEAVDLATGEPLYELPPRGSDAAADDIRDFLVADGRIYLASMQGIRISEGTGEAYAGISSPVTGHTFTGPDFSYSWGETWNPIQTSWLLGEDGLQFQSGDGQALVTQYVQGDIDGRAPGEVAWSIAGVPAEGGSVSLDPAPLVSSFPRSFGPDTSRLLGLESARPPEMPAPVQPDAGVALVRATTRLNPPFDTMPCLIVVVPLPDPDRMLVFELASSEQGFGSWLELFLDFFKDLKIG